MSSSSDSPSSSCWDHVAAYCQSVERYLRGSLFGCKACLKDYYYPLCFFLFGWSSWILVEGMFGQLTVVARTRLFHELSLEHDDTTSAIISSVDTLIEEGNGGAEGSDVSYLNHRRQHANVFTLTVLCWGISHGASLLFLIGRDLRFMYFPPKNQDNDDDNGRDQANGNNRVWLLYTIVSLLGVLLIMGIVLSFMGDNLEFWMATSSPLYLFILITCGAVGSLSVILFTSYAASFDTPGLLPLAGLHPEGARLSSRLNGSQLYAASGWNLVAFMTGSGFGRVIASIWAIIQQCGGHDCDNSNTSEINLTDYWLTIGGFFGILTALMECASLGWLGTRVQGLGDEDEGNNNDNVDGENDDGENTDGDGNADAATVKEEDDDSDWESTTDFGEQPASDTDDDGTGPFHHREAFVDEPDSDVSFNRPSSSPAEYAMGFAIASNDDNTDNPSGFHRALVDIDKGEYNPDRRLAVEQEEEYDFIRSRTRVSRVSLFWDMTIDRRFRWFNMAQFISSIMASFMSPIIYWVDQDYDNDVKRLIVPFATSFAYTMGAFFAGLAFFLPDDVYCQMSARRRRAEQPCMRVDQLILIVSLVAGTLLWAGGVMVAHYNLQNGYKANTNNLRYPLVMIHFWFILFYGHVSANSFLKVSLMAGRKEQHNVVMSHGGWQQFGAFLGTMASYATLSNMLMEPTTNS